MRPDPIDPPDLARRLDRVYVVGLVCMAVLIVAFPLYRLGEPRRRAEAREAMARQAVAMGREAFAMHCMACHGPEGRGVGVAPTLAAREFLAGVNDQQLEWLIAGGIPGTTMSAYHIDLGGPFTPQEISRLVRYLRSLEEGAPSVPEWRSGALAPPRVVAARAAPDEAHRERTEREAAHGAEPAGVPLILPPAGDPATLAHGPGSITAEALYAGNCVACHGVQGEGTAVGPRIRPPREGLGDDSVRLLIARGKPGTAMMAFGAEAGGRLSAEQVDGLVRWLRAGGRDRR
jgi:mono/diheme cytochrome c family protein